VILDTVHEVEKMLLEEKANHEYAGIAGLFILLVKNGVEIGIGDFMDLAQK